MSIATFFERASQHLSDMLGLNMKYLAGPQDRIRYVRVTILIGAVVGGVFGLFNMLTPSMQLLGLVEWAAVLFLLLPAAFLMQQARWITLVESLVMLSALMIFGALIVFGGIEGTGLYWIYTVPFLAFFLKGQKQGWWYSLGFVVVVAAYLVAGGELAYRFTPTVVTQFVLSLFYYTLIAANFNLLRSRFEEKLAQKVEEKTADADKLMAQLTFLASHNPITGLPNRNSLLEQLQQELAAAQAQGHGLAVCTLRLERLFEMGNVLGQAATDKLVCQVAAHLAQIAQGHGLLAHTRRDEFVMVYRLHSSMASTDTLGKFICQRQITVQEQGLSLYIELTLGLAVFPDHSADAALLLRKAEQAMLQAKKNVQQWSVYDAQQEQLFMRHQLLFGKLRDALIQNQLTMHFQPQIDLASGHICGVEALVRWPDPVEGMIGPIEFVPVAEESGLIRPLTIWVLNECLRDFATWSSSAQRVDISINLSALNLLDPELPGILNTILDTAKINPGHVVLEITESCFMLSPQRALAVIQTLHGRGFKLSIDDFGTGYSSLSYLKNMPIDELKIDQSFICQLLDSERDQAIVSSTIALAHNFGLRVVAEGIENQATAQWLRANGCDIGQGYLFAKPMPLNEFLTYVQAHAPR